MGCDENCSGKTVLVTGAAGGLGAALCKRFGEAGGAIAALDRDGEGLNRMADDLKARGIDIRTYLCDVTSEDESNQTVAKVIADFGGIDVLINNAGIAHRSAFVKTKPAVIRKVIEVSLLGSVYCTSAAIQSLIERQGMVIGISSIAGFSPLAGRTGYSAAKHGLTGFLETLRTEVADLGVGVMIVHATYIKTNIDKNALDGEGNQNRNEKIPSGTVLMPDEAAEEIFKAALRRERMLLLGENAQQAWDLYHSNPLLYEKIMLDMNRYVLEQ